MVPNAPKWYRTHQNMSLGSNGVDWVRSLRNNSMQLRGMNFCTSLECFSPSFVRQLNCPKCTQMVQNTPKHEFRVQWCGSGAFVAKKPTQLCGTNFCINMLHRVSCSDETVPNAPKHYKMHEDLSFGSNGADKLRLLRKIPTSHKVLH